MEERRKRLRKKREHEKRERRRRCKHVTTQLIKRDEENRQEKEGKTEEKRKRGWSLGRMGRWFFLMLMIGQSLTGVNAASENAQNRGGKMDVSQGARKTMKSSWVQMSDKRKFQQENEKSRSEMQEDSKMVRWTILNGSAWCTDRKFL